MNNLDIILGLEQASTTNDKRTDIRVNYAIQPHEVADREYHCATHVILRLRPGWCEDDEAIG